MKDMMVDIESLGVGNHCCIIQIGACYFDRDTGDIGKTFKVNIDARSAVKAGGDLEADTVYWWLSQSREAIDSILKEPLEDITLALNSFNLFAEDAKCIWSHATFDFVAIVEAMKRSGLKPLSFRKARDIRTLIDLAHISTTDTPRTGLHHDGLEDAKHQVKYCMEAFKKLKRREEHNGKI